MLETTLVSHNQNGAHLSPPPHDILDLSAALPTACDPGVVSRSAGCSLPCLQAADFSSVEIMIHDIHHCSPEHKACFAAIKGY